MNARTMKIMFWIGGVGLLIYLLYSALRPSAIGVDVAGIDRGAIIVTVDEEGVTRIRDVYRVSVPIGGHLARSSLKVGDPVTAGDVVAAIHPADSPFLDARSRREIEAGIQAASAAISVATAELKRVRSQLAFAQSTLERTRALADKQTVSRQTLDQAVLEVDSLQARVGEAQAALELRRREFESAQAKRLQPGETLAADVGDGCCVQVTAPVDGVVLRLFEENEQVVAAGAPLLEVGNTQALEIVAELLSSDAVRVQPGASAVVDGWGGDTPLSAQVRQVDPAGFTKVSALGIEEQRVNAVLDLAGPPERWQRLGHDYHVFVRIEVWRDDDALRVPLGAPFRDGDQWAVFVVNDGMAELRGVQLGQRNSHHAEVVAGLDEGERVILHPNDQIDDGTRVAARAP